MAHSGTTRAKAAPAKKTSTSRRWSQKVTETSDALDLEQGVFAQDDPKKIARSLKRSAEHSERRKSDPYRSAMSMLTVYINRAGHRLDASRRERLERAKDELRRLFGRGDASPRAGARARGAASPRQRTRVHH